MIETLAENLAQYFGRRFSAENQPDARVSHAHNTEICAKFFAHYKNGMSYFSL